PSIHLLGRGYGYRSKFRRVGECRRHSKYINRRIDAGSHSSKSATDVFACGAGAFGLTALGMGFRRRWGWVGSLTIWVLLIAADLRSFLGATCRPTLGT